MSIIGEGNLQYSKQYLLDQLLCANTTAMQIAEQSKQSVDSGYDTPNASSTGKVSKKETFDMSKIEHFGFPDYLRRLRAMSPASLEREREDIRKKLEPVTTNTHQTRDPWELMKEFSLPGKDLESDEEESSESMHTVNQKGEEEEVKKKKNKEVVKTT